MKRHYLSTFISGLAEPVRHALTADVPDAEVELLLDGLVVYGSEAGPERIEPLRFFNNSFVMLKTMGKVATGGSDAPVSVLPDQLLKVLLGEAELTRMLREDRPQGPRTFRIVISQENQTVSADRNLVVPLEHRIAAATGLVVDRSLPDVEYWLLIRSEGVAFFLRRLTRHTAYEKVLAPGELRPQLAHLLCRLSEPTADDAFLDPMAGSGAIAFERAEAFAYRQVFAGDIDREKVARLRAANRGRAKPILVRPIDVLDMTRFAEGSFTRIVTDPPWGMYRQASTDLGEFYRKMLEQFGRLVMSGGIVVVLTGAKEVMEAALHEANSGLELVEKYDILVSGKKAGIYKLRRRQAG